MEHRDAATYDIWLHAVAIKPNSSKDHQAVAPKSRDFFQGKKGLVAQLVEHHTGDVCVGLIPTQVLRFFP